MGIMPQGAKRFFWDVDPEALEADQDAEFIIRRLLEWGDLSEIKWLLATYPQNLLERQLRLSHALSPKSAHFWSALLNIPLGELQCMQRRSISKHEIAWPY